MTEFKDSGERQAFGTGAVRDVQGGKGRFDLLPYDALHQLACTYETGCEKYGPRNWEKGIPCSRYLNSALRHLTKANSGATDEPHLPMAAWNVMCAMQTFIWVKAGKLPAELADVDMELFGFESLTQPAVDLSFVQSQTPIVEISGDTFEPPDGIVRTECLMGHRVDFYEGDTTGYIDGVYTRGTDFTSRVSRWRRGFETVDEEMSARAAEDLNAEAPGWEIVS